MLVHEEPVSEGLRTNVSVENLEEYARTDGTARLASEVAIDEACGFLGL
jgi:hypothetical protein